MTHTTAPLALRNERKETDMKQWQKVEIKGIQEDICRLSNRLDNLAMRPIADKVKLLCRANSLLIKAYNTLAVATDDEYMDEGD